MIKVEVSMSSFSKWLPEIYITTALTIHDFGA
jgi:hypothetical protein